ncbi:hypothetical protein ACFW55_12475, partial [Streptomyces sp. NPDC058745]
MITPAHRPLLFLDVDGPLIPFGAAPDAYPTYATGDDRLDFAANPLLTRIDPAHGPRLSALACDIVWATTWMADANECVALRLGRVAKVAPSARRAGLAASGACARKAEGRPRT